MEESERNIGMGPMWESNHWYPTPHTTNLTHYSLQLSKSTEPSSLFESPQNCKYSSNHHPTAAYERYQQLNTADKKERSSLVENLVDVAANVIGSIWSQQTEGKTEIIPINQFIREVLKRSKTTYSTLQIALFYLFRIKNVIIARLQKRVRESQSRSSSGEFTTDDYLCCGRRMFLASLMVASKYLQDKNYRNKAWCKISGLSIQEINGAEIAFLQLIDYRLFISKPTFDRWYTLLNFHMDQMRQSGRASKMTAKISHLPLSYPSPQQEVVDVSACRPKDDQGYPSPPYTNRPSSPSYPSVAAGSESTLAVHSAFLRTDSGIALLENDVVSPNSDCSSKSSLKRSSEEEFPGIFEQSDMKRIRINI